MHLLALLLSSTLFSPTAPAADPPLAPAFAITGGKVIVAPGKVLDEATVVIRDGRIVRVGSDVDVPPDAFPIDATGLVVSAGFLDAGRDEGYDKELRRAEVGPEESRDIAEEAYPSLPLGFYPAMTPEFDVTGAVKWDDDKLEGWRLRGFLTRHVAPTGAIVSGQGAVFQLSGEPVQRSLVRAGGSVPFDMGYRQRAYPATVMGKLAQMRQILADARYRRDVAGRLGRGDDGADAAVSNPALAALEPLLDGRGVIDFHANLDYEIRRALRMGEEWQVPVRIVGGHEAHKLADELKQRDVAVIYSLDLPEKPKAEKPGDQYQAAPKRVQDERVAKWRELLGGLAKLDAAGVRVGLSTQGVDAGKVDKNLRLLIDEGKVPAEVVHRALTTGAAQVLGVDDRLGTVAAGQRAAVVVTQGEPLEKKTYARYAFVDRRFFEYEPVPEKKDEEKDGDEKDEDADKPDAEKSGDADEAKPEDEEMTADEAADKQTDDVDPAEAAGKTEPTEQETELSVASELLEDRQPTREANGNVLLRGATLLTVSDAGDLAAADLLIQGGKIAAIGQGLEAPAGATVIDATGLYAMPGMIDTHSHMALDGVNEYTDSITAEVRIGDAVVPTDPAIYRAVAGGTTLARLLHGSANVIGGQDAQIKLKYGKTAEEMLVPDAPRGIKFALGENVTRRSGRFPSSRMGVEATMVRAFTAAQEYQKAWDDYRRDRARGRAATRPRKDYRLDTLAGVLAGDVQVHCHSYRADEILVLLRVAEQFGFRITSLQHALEAYKIAPEIAAHGASISTFSDWWAYKWEAYDATPFNTALCREAGISICLKSDSDELVRHMNNEAAKLLRYGLPDPEAALETVTIIPARQLGIADRVGSLEVGKDGDVALFNGHPLNNYSRCVMTFIEGDVYFEDRGIRRPKDGIEGEPNDVAAEDAEVNQDAIADAEPEQPEDAPLLERLLGAMGDSEQSPPGDNPLTLAEMTRPEDAPRAWGPENAEVLQLINATVCNPGAEPQPGQMIVVRDGRVTDVRRTPQVMAEEPNLRTIDLAGRRVYPGFIDAGSKVGLIEVSSARETIDYQEEGQFQPDLRAGSAIHPDSELIPVTRASGVLAAVTLPEGGTISGQSALLNLNGWTPAQMLLEDPLALHIQLPSLPDKNESVAKPFMGRGKLASVRNRRLLRIKQLFARAKQYRQARGIEGATTPVDPRLEALIPYLDGKRPVVFRASRANDLLAAIELAEQIGVKPILRGCRDAWKIVDTLAEKQIPCIVGPVMTLPGADYDPYDAVYTLPAKLHAAGVPFCLQTDDASNARNLPFEAAMAVAHGLPADVGLRSITLSPAEILGVADKLGTLAEGKVANLIVCDGDPLQTTTRIDMLLIGGQAVDPGSKHTLLYDRYRQRLAERDGVPAADPVGEN